MSQKKKIKAHIFVYYVEDEGVPTKRHVREGWRAEVVSVMPNHEDIYSRIHKNKEGAINEVMQALYSGGYYGSTDIWTMDYTS